MDHLEKLRQLAQTGGSRSDAYFEMKRLLDGKHISRDEASFYSREWFTEPKGYLGMRERAYRRYHEQAMAQIEEARNPETGQESPAVRKSIDQWLTQEGLPTTTGIDPDRPGSMGWSMLGGAAQGALMGWADDIAGAVPGVSAEAFRENLDMAASKAPGRYLGAELAGAMLPVGRLGKAGKLAGKLPIASAVRGIPSGVESAARKLFKRPKPRKEYVPMSYSEITPPRFRVRDEVREVGRGIREGAAYGAVEGSGRSDEDRVSGGLLGGLVGGALGGGLLGATGFGRGVRAGFHRLNRPESTSGVIGQHLARELEIDPLSSTIIAAGRDLAERDEAYKALAKQIPEITDEGLLGEIDRLFESRDYKTYIPRRIAEVEGLKMFESPTIGQIQRMRFIADSEGVGPVRKRIERLMRNYENAGKQGDMFAMKHQEDNPIFTFPKDRDGQVDYQKPELNRDHLIDLDTEEGKAIQQYLESDEDPYVAKYVRNKMSGRFKTEGIPRENNPSFDDMHNVMKSLRDNQRTRQAGVELNAMMREGVPGYAQVEDAYAHSSKLLEAGERGMKEWSATPFATDQARLDLGEEMFGVYLHERFSEITRRMMTRQDDIGTGQALKMFMNQGPAERALLKDMLEQYAGGTPLDPNKLLAELDYIVENEQNMTNLVARMVPFLVGMGAGVSPRWNIMRLGHGMYNPAARNSPDFMRRN